MVVSRTFLKHRYLLLSRTPPDSHRWPFSSYFDRKTHDLAADNTLQKNNQQPNDVTSKQSSGSEVVRDPKTKRTAWEVVEPIPFPKPPVLPGVEGQPVYWVVPSTEDGSRLDRFIKRRAPGLSAGLIQRLIRQRKIGINSEIANQNNWELYTDDVVRFPGEIKLGFTRGKQKPPADDISLAEATAVRSWLLHRDARSAVLNKPAGLPVVPRGPSFVNPLVLSWEARKPPEKRLRVGKGAGPLGTDGDRCLQDLLYGLGEGHYWVVHRLDKDVSGAIVVARDVGAAGLLAEYFRTRMVQKTYWALVQGWVKFKAGNIQIPIDGKRAYTGFRIIHRIDRSYAWVELYPRTGRKHQLRIHCAEGLGCPIVGDSQHGSENEVAENNLGGMFSSITTSSGLHLMSRNIKYPVLTENSVGAKRRKRANVVTRFVEVSAPLPPHMKDTWKRLGLREDMATGVDDSKR